MIEQTLPPGWTPYSQIDRGQPHAGLDFGARRDDRLAFCFGRRNGRGEKKDILAQLQTLTPEDHGPRQRIFERDRLVDACTWCDDRLREIDAATGRAST
jgi:hypothetical protein